MQRLLLLFLLLSPVAMVTSVDGCHSDRDKDHRPRENCTGAGFRDIPVGLDPRTKVLLFSNNLFSALSWTSFQVFTEIYELDLSANKIPEVTPSPAPVLPVLGVLRLGSNHLTVLPDGSFTACPVLTELHLENNSISALSEHSFSGLSKLKILDLTANQIAVLPDHLLHPLTAIETLYLENNQIKVMPNNWFIQKEEVPYLYLSANPWACSCSLSYLHKYLTEYDYNVYVRDGPIIQVDVQSLVCDSPEERKGTPVFTLEESDLCSVSTEPGPPEVVHMTTGPGLPEEVHRTTGPGPPEVVHRTTEPGLPGEVHMTMGPGPPGEVHRVVTSSWYQTFTRYFELQFTSGSEIKTKQSSGESFDVIRQPTAGGPTKPMEPTEDVLSTTTPTIKTIQTSMTWTTTPAVDPTMNPTVDPTVDPTTTPTVRTLTRTEVTTTWISSRGFAGSAGSPGPVGVFCVWLFAGCLLLCSASAACVLVTLVRLVIWYRTIYSPVRVTLVRRITGGEGAELLMQRRTEEKGVVALYRSVLFVSREEEEAVEEEEATLTRVIPPRPTGGEEEGGRMETGVYRKTLYRVVRKEEEIEGWRDVMEECRVSGRRRGKDLVGGEGGGAKKRFSVILREEREESEGRRAELDWVVGGWEVKRGAGGGEDPRSSWGEWLATYLPSMPWGVTTPPEDEAAQCRL